MPGISDLGARALRWLPPETAHGVAVGLLRWGLAPAARSMPPPSLHVKLWGLEFPSPLGLAAGFDKNAAALRGLYRLGLDLGLDACADLGGLILVEEAGRIFLPSGVLREGSSHYHLLAARNYADAWLAARAHDRYLHETPRPATLMWISQIKLMFLDMFALG